MAQAAQYRAANPEKIKAWKRQDYLRHKPRDLAKNRRVKRVLRDWMRTLKQKPCMDCGGTFPPECMDFDHRNSAEKVAAVSRIAEQGRSATLAEIAKCDLVCANCHRIRTARRRRAFQPSQPVP